MVRPYEGLKYAGYFDVGAGAAFVFDTRRGHDDDAGGIPLSLKAYPYGRWYSPAKSSPQDSAAAAAASAREQVNKATLADPTAAQVVAADATQDAVSKAIHKFQLEDNGELAVVKGREGFKNRFSIA